MMSSFAHDVGSDMAATDTQLATVRPLGSNPIDFGVTTSNETLFLHTSQQNAGPAPHPSSNSSVIVIYYFCVDHLDSSCYGYTQIVSLIWGCLFIIFFFASVLLLPIFRSTWRNIKVTRKSSSVYIDDDNKPTPAVQPIFNINSGPTPVAQPVPQQIMLPPQLLQQYAGPQVHQVPPAPASQQQTQIPQRPQQLYPAQPQTQNIMTPSGVIHLNLYTIQLPNGNNTYVTTSPIIDQLSTDCFEMDTCDRVAQLAHSTFFDEAIRARPTTRSKKSGKLKILKDSEDDEYSTVDFQGLNAATTNESFLKIDWDDSDLEDKFDKFMFRTTCSAANCD
ncbi:hypothetical protein L5515_016847 [Caenorhabditis briggsae]|uniref:Uncharacterized protein n=1 Tax=Caenorhabditis briggsae TaxID=6238 RepID=A0AAE9FCA6_CAEBR|nr:hypothetical protein L5515_016847 [Caenorhabditis briggsae]